MSNENEHDHEVYVTAVDAAKLLGKSIRQIHRYIEDKKLPATRNESGHWSIAISDVEAMGDTHLELLKPIEQLKIQAQTIATLQAQVDELREALATMQQEFAARITAQDERIVKLQATIRKEYEAQSVLNKLMALKPDAMESIDVNALREKRATVGSLARELSQLEKRDLPLGSVTLAAFCKRHTGREAVVHGSTVKGMVEAADRVGDLVTIWHRPTASTYTHEWWLKPEQQPAMIRFWQERGKPFVPCPDCPHEDNGAASGSKETSEAPIPSAEMAV